MAVITGVKYITAEARTTDVNLTDNVQFSSILVSKRNDSSSARGVVRMLSGNTGSLQHKTRHCPA